MDVKAPHNPGRAAKRESASSTAHLPMSGKACSLESEVRRLRQQLKAEIHRRRAAEAALGHQRTACRSAFEISPNAIWVQRWTDEVLTEINPGFEALLGYTAKEVRGKRGCELGIWAVPEQYDALMHKLGRSDHPIEIQADLRTRAGDIVHTRINAGLIHLEGKVHLLAIARNVTDLWNTLTSLRDSEETYRTVFENTGAATVVIEADMTISMANDRCERLCGYRREEIEGRMKILDVIAPEYHEMVRQFHFARRAGTPNVPTEFELTLIQKDGRAREVVASVRLIPGTQRGIVTIIDMSEKRRAEQERLRLAAVIEQSSEAVLITDTQGTIQYVNPSVETLTGRPATECLGAPLEAIMADEAAAAAFARMQQVGSTTDAWYGRIERQLAGGSATIADTRIYPIQNRKGAVISYVCIQRDVTQENRMETQLRQAQRMEAIGTLASGIAHDFNNILTGLIGHAELAGKEAPTKSRTKERIDHILGASLRARDLVNQILTYTRQKDQAHHPVEVRHIVKEALKLLQATLPANIEIQYAIPRDSGVVLGNPSELHQVVLNLCTNAAHAMSPRGGRLAIRLSNQALNERRNVTTGDLAPGNYICLSISDTGHGMTAETIERIFEPYFTTKEPGEGTGLGLAVTHGIVTRLAGQIDICSDPGRGARFEIYLPRASRSALRRERSRTRIPGGDANILIVDDEIVIIELLSEILTSLGYSVTAESDSNKALTLFEAAPDLVDLVITDLNMPGLSGKDLIEAIRTETPEKPILVITGDTNLETEKDPVIRQAQAFLRKPIRIRQFADTVHELVA